MYHGSTFADLFRVEPWEDLFGVEPWEDRFGVAPRELVCEYEGVIDDESLLDRLTVLASILDPVPDSVTLDARAMFKPDHRSSQPARSRQIRARGDG